MTDHEATIATLRAERDEARRRVASLETSIEKTAELEREGYKALHYSEELQRAEAAEMKLIAAEASLAEVRKALEDFAKHVNWELDWGNSDPTDESSDCVWRVHACNGGRNDREWTLLGTGDTPLAAIKSALARLDTPEKK